MGCSAGRIDFGRLLMRCGRMRRAPMSRFDRTLPTTVHGHYWVRPATDPPGDGRPTPLLVGFHGYGETAEDHLAALESVPGAETWTLAAVQAPHPFYTRTGKVVACWMTRLDRELAIADNTAYAAAAVEAIRRETGASGPLVFAGFSQGVAMAYRAAAAVPCAGLIALAGDVPPDVDPAALPRLLIGRGLGDEWYDEAKMGADLDRLRPVDVTVETCVFDGGHEWGRAFRDAAGAFLHSIVAPAS